MYGAKNFKNRDRQKKENNLLVGKKQREKGDRGRKGDKIIERKRKRQRERNIDIQREIYVEGQNNLCQWERKDY